MLLTLHSCTANQRFKQRANYYADQWKAYLCTRASNPHYRPGPNLLFTFVLAVARQPGPLHYNPPLGTLNHKFQAQRNTLTSAGYITSKTAIEMVHVKLHVKSLELFQF